MTTGPHDEHGEILRRALHAEAERVTPSADGLERIRAGIAERERRRFPVRSGWDWFTANWTRPVLAVGAALAIAGLGVSAPQTFDLIQSPMGNDGPFAKSHHGSPSGTGTDSTDSSTPPQGSPTPGHDPSGTAPPRTSEGPVSSTTTPTCPPETEAPSGEAPSTQGSTRHQVSGKSGPPSCPTHTPTPPTGTPTPTPSTPTPKPTESSSPPPTTTPEGNVTDAPATSG
ncbi:hypothetical protein [Actinomadura harenae]|uniref:Uncharacterized protein n=1 Tax=Actinomadura harenae TaxID=2483351 RepID=A0A3M2MER3_9ACTN|nr:hypothetical protein [Actinomadura harenae]RMI47115.1 hypothetical protein EBO15_04305 [Actinomadura harenae]